MTETKRAILAYIANKLYHYNHPKANPRKALTPEQRRLLIYNDIVIQRDGKYWRVYREGILIAKAERRWHVTKTNPKPREIMPRFKERF